MPWKARARLVSGAAWIALMTGVLGVAAQDRDPAARLTDAWVLAHHFKPDTPGAFPLEYEFTDGTTVAWVRMFLWVAPDTIRPVKPGGRMELYVHRIALGQLGPVAVALQARELP